MSQGKSETTRYLPAYELAKFIYPKQPRYQVQTPLGWDLLKQAHRWGNYRDGDRVTLDMANGTHIVVDAHAHIQVRRLADLETP